MATRPDDGGPAFPTTTYYDDRPVGIADGMSLRDYFAAEALGTMRFDPWTDNPDYWAGVARSAYVAADAMLKARSKA